MALRVWQLLFLEAFRRKVLSRLVCITGQELHTQPVKIMFLKRLPSKAANAFDILPTIKVPPTQSFRLSGGQVCYCIGAKLWHVFEDMSDLCLFFRRRVV